VTGFCALESGETVGGEVEAISVPKWFAVAGQCAEMVDLWGVVEPDRHSLEVLAAPQPTTDAGPSPPRRNPPFYPRPSRGREQTLAKTTSS
jgi:hypothetical protein